MPSTQWPKELVDHLEYYKRPNSIPLRQLSFDANEPSYKSLIRKSSSHPFGNAGSQTKPQEVVRNKRTREGEKVSIASNATQAPPCLFIQDLLRSRHRESEPRVYVGLWNDERVVAKIFDDWSSTAYTDARRTTEGDYTCAREVHAYKLLESDSVTRTHFVKFHGLFEARIDLPSENKFAAVILLEYFDGITLNCIQATKTLSRAVRLDILAKIAIAAHAGYQTQVVCKSIKPETVMIGRETTHVKLIYLGNWSKRTNEVHSYYGYTGQSTIKMHEWECYVGNIHQNFDEWTSDITVTDLVVAAKCQVNQVKVEPEG